MKHARCTVLILAVAALAGCASVRTTTEGWWKGVTGSDAEAGRQGAVYYAASDGLVVHASASGSSATVGRLTLHQRVTRTELKSGWAYVTTDGGLAGWVDNAQLIWRLPAAGAAQDGASQAPAATQPPTNAPAPAQAPPPAAAPTAEPAAAPADAAPAEAVPPPIAPTPAASPAPRAPVPAAPRGQPSADMFDPF